MSRKIAAVLVTYNRLAKLKLAITSTLAQEIDYVVVVNNNSSDGTREWLEEQSKLDSRLKVENLEENTGGAGGFYHGCKFASENLDAGWLLLFDDDAYPAADLITKFKALEISAQTGAITCAVYTPDGEIANFNRPGFNPFKSPVHLMRYLLRGGHYLSREELANARGLSVDISSFVGFIVSTNAIKGRLGYPCKELFIYCDDWLYSLELSELSYKNLYYSDLVFYHDSQTFIDSHDAQLWKKYYAYRNSIVFYKRAAGLFFPIVLSIKVCKWLIDTRLYQHKLKYLQTLLKSFYDGMSFKY